MKVPQLRCDLRTYFKVKRSKVKRSKVKVTRHINADTHPAAYLPMRTYCIPLVVVVWHISSPFLYQFTPNLRAVFWGTATLQLSPIFENRFPDLEFCRRKTIICQFPPSKQQHLLLSLLQPIDHWRSIAMTYRPAHWRAPTPNSP